MTVETGDAYDDGNIFARILRGEIPATKVFEDDHTLAFRDIAPWAPTHVLVIPKGRYVTWQDFAETGSAAEIVSLVRATARIARAAGVADPGYRLLANIGRDAHGEVPHLHVHILAGRPLGPMLASRETE